MAMTPFVVVQRNADDSYTIKAEVDADLLIVDIAAMQANPSLAIQHVARLMSYQHPDAFPLIDELLAWFQANAVVTPT